MRLINYFKRKFFEPRETVLASNTISVSQVREKLGKDAEGLSDAEVFKKLQELPLEEQMFMFFPKKNDNN